MRKYVLTALLALVSAMVGTTVTADNIRVIRQSSVTLQHTEREGAVAEVVFDNTSTNLPSDNTNFPLSLGDVDISVTFIFNEGGGGNDTIIVDPNGRICVPSDCRLNTLEGFVQKIYLYDLESVGM